MVDNQGAAHLLFTISLKCVLAVGIYRLHTWLKNRITAALAVTSGAWKRGQKVLISDSPLHKFSSSVEQQGFEGAEADTFHASTLSTARIRLSRSNTVPLCPRRRQ